MKEMISNTPDTLPIGPITSNHIMKIPRFMYGGWVGQFWTSTILYTYIALKISGSINYRLISTLLFEQSAQFFWTRVSQI